MELSMKINNVKSISDFTMKFPLEQGLYAITGENASGKSTLVACASTVFFTMPMYDYFGRPDGNASIEFSVGDATRSWHYRRGVWERESSNRMPLKGFYEGSIVFGNRFKDTTFATIKKLDKITSEDLEIADDFIKNNLGLILHDDINHYNQLFRIKREVARDRELISEPFFYKTNNKYISQIRMSTGENLLLSILNSIHLVCGRRPQPQTYSNAYIVFLDEIELALHASALRRLAYFLEDVAKQYNLAIFFSTHSLELIRGIKPENIFYLHRYVNNELNVVNPCYPAFATRNLYNDDGYGNDAVILVEDELGKIIVERILIEKSLLNNMRVKVLPTGGWTNVIMLAHDVITSRLMLKDTKILLVLDKDIECDVPQFFHNHPKYQYLKPDFLPISSLEKYLKEKLIDKVDQKFYLRLDNYVFQGKPLNSIILRYKANADWQNDKDGKTLFNMLSAELRSIRKNYSDLIDTVVKYLLENDTDRVNALADYLREKLK